VTPGPLSVGASARRISFADSTPPETIERVRFFPWTSPEILMARSPFIFALNASSFRSLSSLAFKSVSISFSAPMTIIFILKVSSMVYPLSVGDNFRDR
jgi:hypothetical protein